MPDEFKPPQRKLTIREQRIIDQNKIIEQRTASKKLAENVVDSLDPERVKALLRDIRVLELFLLGENNTKESTNYVKGQKRTVYSVAYDDIYRLKRKGGKISKKEEDRRYAEDLKYVIGGIVNLAPQKKIVAILANPEEFSDIIKSAPFAASLEKPETNNDVITEDVTASIPKPPLPIVHGEKIKVDEFSEVEESQGLNFISEVAMSTWPDFHWGKPSILLEAVKDDFKKRGIDVRVEFFRPNDPRHGLGDYIVIALNNLKKDGMEKGIVVPRNGVVLDAEMTFDLFLGPKPGRQVSPNSLLSFPQVRREFVDNKSVATYWKIIKHGEMREVVGV